MIDLLSLSLPRIFGALLVSIGLVMAGGGLCLVWLGGSPYYAIFGALLIVSGFLAAMKRHGGASVYCAALLLTVTWSISEVGLHSWLLLPRLDVPLVLGAFFLLPWLQSRMANRGIGVPARMLFSTRAMRVASAALLVGAALGATTLELPGRAYSAIAGGGADPKPGS